MTFYQLRPAVKADAPAIHKLIWQAHINPMGLHWARFIVAVNQHDEVIGCAQIKLHRDGSRELASLAVHPNQRSQGIGRALIEQLLTVAPRPLYLTCRSSLRSLYEKFGFSVQAPEQMTPYFSRLHKLVQILTSLFRRNESMLVMVLY
jgi:N-acetylglutamate synthase-like GNAT family acetyltransferase